MSKQHIGVVGMAVMGRNLALNMSNKGYSVSIYNRSNETTKKVADAHPEANLVPYYDMKSFVDSLEKPRRILIMVKAGEPTDTVINSLKPLLDKGDIIIDGGNANFEDTIRRNKALSDEGFNFIGAGVSGGEEGALKGPSIMPGGQKEAYDLVAPMLDKIAAKCGKDACVTYIGPNGAGHYVKMVHNGIEYGDIQLIAESYSILKLIGKLSNDELAQVFSEWNKGELDSYLIEITAHIFRKKDKETGQDLIDLILDSAANKGTGKWTSQNALDLGEPLSLITESVFARYISALKSERVTASKVLFGPMPHYNGNKATLIAKIFRGGCIIRAGFLHKISEAYIKSKQNGNLLLTPYFKEKVENYQDALRDIVCLAVQSGVPVPALGAAISYYDSYRAAVLPANLIQAQRDYFGAHTYQRTDKDGTFHTDWSN